MDYQRIDQKKDHYQQNKRLLRCNPDFLERFEQSFLVSYTDDSTAIEGNQLTREEKRQLLADGHPGRNLARDAWEVLNHRKAYYRMVEAVRKKRPLELGLVHDLHSTLMEHIMAGGGFREGDMFLTNSVRSFPPPEEVPYRMAEWAREAEARSLVSGMDGQPHVVELAAWTHAEFTDIHPYPDGNGRLARLLMNFQLQRNGLIPVSIKQQDYGKYKEALEEYQEKGTVNRLSEMIAGYEEKQLDILIEQEQIIQRGRDISYDFKL